MKKKLIMNTAFLCFSVLISIASHSQDFFAYGKGQQTEVKLKLQPTDYLKKAKKQRSVGMMLLGGGATCIAVGSVVQAHATDKDVTGFAIIFVGMGMAAGSLPFFISSAVTKHKAKIYMKREAFMITPQRQSNIAYNSIGLRLSL